MKTLPFDPSLAANQVLTWQLPPLSTMTQDKKGFYFYYHIKGNEAVAVLMMVCGKVHPGDFRKIKRWKVDVVCRLEVETIKLTPLAKGQRATMNGFAISEEGELRILPMLRSPQQVRGKDGIRQAVVRAEAESVFA